MSIIISNDSNLPACSAVPQNSASSRAPVEPYTFCKYIVLVAVQPFRNECKY